MLMPVIPLSHLSDAERLIADRIIAGQGKNKGRLRAAKPKVDKVIVEKDGRKYHESTIDSGKAAYLWRIVAFSVSPLNQHHCLPIMADMDLPYFNVSNDDRKIIQKEMDALANKITDAMPKDSWHGIMAWKRAMLG